MANSLITAGADNRPGHSDSSPEARMSEAKKDTRVFMYRKDESRLFDGPEHVPEGEGWVDHPDKVAPVPLEDSSQTKTQHRPHPQNRGARGG
jgi:hypothetical protein